MLGNGAGGSRSCRASEGRSEYVRAEALGIDNSEVATNCRGNRLCIAMNNVCVI